ncbi:unnamed protein product [Dicrocoelium dendriticum]|nr:unnamed protein product [Dicrocoelium dendriticum]
MYVHSQVSAHTNETQSAPSVSNPGYLYGQQVIGARSISSSILSTTADSNAVTMVPTSTVELEGGKLRGTYRTSYGQWNILAGGPCPVLQHKVYLAEPLLFGHDTFGGCMFSPPAYILVDSPYSDWNSICSILQNLLWNMLVSGQVESGPSAGRPITYWGSQPDHLAVWPISLTNRSGDWVPIHGIYGATAPKPPVGKPGLCSGLLVGQDTEIQFARFGSLISPQYRIVGAKATHIYGDVHFGPSNPQVEITVRIRFIDVSPPAIPIEKEPPLLLVRLPSDFFYPFF